MSTSQEQQSLVSANQLPSPLVQTMGDITVVEETLKRISSHKGVLGVIIISGDGIPIR